MEQKKFKCEECKKSFGIDKFSDRDLLNKTLFNTKLICKKCKNIISCKKSYEKNKEKRLAYAKTYCQTKKGKEVRKKINAKYFQTHKEEIYKRNKIRRKKLRTESDGD